MELCFYCPEKGRVFKTRSFEVRGCGHVLLKSDGSRSLQGEVRVACPLCGETHVFDPADLPCPLDFRGDSGDTSNTMGGE